MQGVYLGVMGLRASTWGRIAGILGVVCLPGQATWAAKNADREALKKVLLDVVKHSPFESARVSLQVQSLDDGAVILSHNGDELLNPASNVKLFTAAAALAVLGPDYRFETEFLLDDSPQATRPRALYVRGKGDPSITTERLYAIVSELFHDGLREVGDIVLDDSWFDPERLAPGFDQENSDRAYMAPTGALSLNWNTITVYLRGGERIGAAASVELEPASEYFTIEKSVSTAARLGRRFSVQSEQWGDKQKIIVRGTVPLDRGSIAVWRKIDNPPIYFGDTLKRMFADHGIKVKGRVRLGMVPTQSRLLHVSQSETFDLILKRLNKVSSNFVAEQLIKTLATEQKGPPGSFGNGIQVVEEFLEKQVGIPRGSYVMRNGSGLNDANRFSAAQIVRLLRVMYERFPLAPEFLSSLGIAGKDGTLRYRFEGSDAVGRLRGKTGTLEKISSLSGYVQSAGGEKFCFAAIVNDYAGRSGPVVQGLDALGVAVAAAGSSQGPEKAVAALMTPETVVKSIEEIKVRVRTYLAIGKQGDKRNITFLRTAWRTERDPAVRAVLAEALYQSNREDYLGIRALLDSFAVTETVYGRLRDVAKELGVEVPGVSSIVELAAQGQAEAMSRVVELCRATEGDEHAQREISISMAEVAKTAPRELVIALKSATPAERAAASARLAEGLSQAGGLEHPFWPALRSIESSGSELASFAKELEGALPIRPIQQDAIASPISVTAGAAAPPVSNQPADARPGG
jgi:D-alanyl-D-alanine carboxypeptidase/D-alanyl-D-alanine-endopeptidase (penicillin-binding protein 4)